ncbi:MAG: hypothetical protein WAO71_11740 [Gallionella sp.]
MCAITQDDATLSVADFMMKKYQHFDLVYVRFFNPPTIMLRPNRIMYQPSGMGAWGAELAGEGDLFHVSM